MMFECAFAQRNSFAAGAQSLKQTVPSGRVIQNAVHIACDQSALKLPEAGAPCRALYSWRIIKVRAPQRKEFIPSIDCADGDHSQLWCEQAVSTELKGPQVGWGPEAVSFPALV